MHLLELDAQLLYAEHIFGTALSDEESNSEEKNSNAQRMLHSCTEMLGPIAYMSQVHGDRIAYADEAGKYEEVDAIYTDNPNLWLAVQTADCVPVLISCPYAVAAAHCGWRGLKAQLLEKVIRTLMKEYHISPNETAIHIGPCISQDNYEVENSFKDIFGEHHFKPSKHKDKSMMDMVGILREQASELGIPDENINDSGVCTYREKDLFNSYRRAKQNGNDKYNIQLSLVKMENRI